MTAASKRSGQHSSKSDDWGTPPEIVAIAQRVLGHIDLDPASSPERNATIAAWNIITREQDGLRTPWVQGAPTPSYVCDVQALRAPIGQPGIHVFLNPPGDKSGELVAGFWRALAGYHQLGWIDTAFYVGFSVEQLARLQRVGAPSHPLLFPTCVPDERIEYMRPDGTRGEQCGHASFLTLVTRSRSRTRDFATAARQLGAVINV